MTELRGSVTEGYIKSRISDTTFIQPDVKPATLTLCVITLDNGFHAVGKSACVDPGLFDPDLGRGLAYQDAFEKLWELFGFALAEERAQ